VSGFFAILRQDGQAFADQWLQKISAELATRGPDGCNLWQRDNISACFAFMRTGPAPQARQQPVSLLDRFYLWGDLRLDARDDLHQQLSGKNCPPDTTSEELLLQAWAKWGPACLQRIIGDFSFALWDAAEKTCWCVRDFVGARPFYYAHTSGVFCFTNTLPLLRRVPEVSGEFDEIFLGDFLTHGWNVDRERTVYRDIRRLPAGHLLKLSNDSLTVERFRKLPIEQPLRLNRPEEYTEAYLGLLTAAVNDRLPQDAVSLFLSGGLDSASVCAVASQIAATRSQKDKLKAFTISWHPFFDDPEPAFAKLSAQHLGLAQEVLQDQRLQPFEGAQSEPCTPEPSDEIFFARDRRFSRRVAAHANVVLSGDGGDDVLIGQAWPYLTYLWRNRKWQNFARDFGGYLWAHQTIPPLRGGFRTRIARWLKHDDPFDGYPSWLNPAFEHRAKLRQRWLDFANPGQNTEHPVHPLAYRLLHDGLWAIVLEIEDAGWNRVTLESRAPMLDLRILQFLLRLPAVPWCMDKELVRQTMKGLLPMEVLSRPKTPLLQDPVLHCCNKNDWLADLPKQAPREIESFVNWSKWCETFHHRKGSLNSVILRPISVLHWLKAVENS